MNPSSQGSRSPSNYVTLFHIKTPKTLLLHRKVRNMSQVVVITGVTSGFGKATAALLVSRGYTVYGISRRTIPDGTGITGITADVRDSDAVSDAIRQIVSKEGGIDILINNAGIGIGGCLELASTDDISLQMDTNFMGCVNLCRAVLPHMRKRRNGRIINISSIGGVMGLPYQGYYSASKFAIEGFSEALSAEVRRFGISVSLVEPGDFSTAFTANRKNSRSCMEDPDYGPSFKRSLETIENEENSGLNPEKLARTILNIVKSRHPKMRYVVAGFEQRASVCLKKILPDRMFVKILEKYYRC